jgi:N-sulfoglucosamine sulfohydrolase
MYGYAGAREGIRFTNAYVTTSSCSPSRCSILSGRYPHNTGAAELHTPLPSDVLTFAEKLKEAGYYTAQAGKWHMGESATRGFDLIQENRKLDGDGGEARWISTLQQRPNDRPFFFWFASYDAHRTWGANDLSGTHDPAKVVIPPYSRFSECRSCRCGYQSFIQGPAAGAIGRAVDKYTSSCFRSSLPC